jgi:anti-repressor protein
LQLQQKEEQLKLQQHELKQSAPKVEYYETVLQSESLINTNNIAKDLGMSAVSLNKILHKNGIIYKSGDNWVLYQKYQGMGFTHTRTHHYVDSKGQVQTALHTYWTEKGRQFIFNAYRKFVPELV